MIYKVNTSSKIFLILLGFFFLFGGIWVYFSATEYRAFYRILYLILAVSISFAFFYSVIFLIHTLRILVDDNRIELFYINIFTRRPTHTQERIISKSTLNWKEIKEVRANFVLFPESPAIILIPFKELNKKRIEFPLQGLPLDLLRDILNHVFPHTTVNFYPYLEKMLQHKPESKRKVICIAAVLTLAIAAVFLLEWFEIRNVAPILSLILLVGLFFATTLWRKR